MKMALLVIDVQEAFVGDRRGTKSFDKIMNHINYSMALFHEAKLPVVVIRDIEDGDGAEMKNIVELDVNTNDIEVTKTYSNAFWKTNLEDILNDLDVDFLVLCGNAAEYCVGATYNGALEREFRTTLLQNGVFATREENLMIHFYNRELISCTALEGIVGFEL